jgi:Spy/CpxP family protein refolding chaperone
MKTTAWKRVWVAGLATLLCAGTTLWAADGQTGAPPRDQAAGPGLRRAERPPRPEPGAGLQLTREQREKMRAAMDELREQMRQIRQDTSLTPEQRREKLRQLQDKQTEKMKEILTPEQFQKWQEQRSQRGAGPGAGPGPRPERRRAGPPANR